MQILALISQKGGTGKTTLALNLAVAAEIDGRPAFVIDLDPQASAKRWDDHREAPFPDVVSAQASRSHPRASASGGCQRFRRKAWKLRREIGVFSLAILPQVFESRGFCN